MMLVRKRIRSSPLWQWFLIMCSTRILGQRRTLVVDPGSMLQDTCDSGMCTNWQNLAKLKIALEQLEPPRHGDMIIEILPYFGAQSTTDYSEVKGDEFLHRKARDRMSDCSANVAEGAEDCPAVYVVIDSHPLAELNPNDDKVEIDDETKERFTFSQFGCAIATSSRTNFNCMREHIRVMIRNIAEHRWTSHMHWQPYLLPQVVQMVNFSPGGCDTDAEGVDDPDNLSVFGLNFSWSQVFTPILATFSVAVLTLIILYTMTNNFAIENPTKNNEGSSNTADDGGTAGDSSSQNQSPGTGAYVIPPGEYTLTDGSGVVVKQDDGTVLGELPKGPIDIHITATYGSKIQIIQPVYGWIELEVITGEKGTAATSEAGRGGASNSATEANDTNAAGATSAAGDTNSSAAQSDSRNESATESSTNNDGSTDNGVDKVTSEEITNQDTADGTQPG